MEEFLNRHALFWKDKTIMYHLLLSAVLLTVSLFFNYYARIYVNKNTWDVASDLLLDNLPVINVAFLFFQGAFIFVLILIGISLYYPKYIPFILESTAVFFLVRSFFMIMTHLSAPSVEYYNYIHQENYVKEVLFTMSSGNDLFFSAHTGYPFLLAFIFWQSKKLRYFFFICSITGAILVILGHLHYSIDVFSAFFIAYGIFTISKNLFKKEYNLIGSQN